MGSRRIGWRLFFMAALVAAGIVATDQAQAQQAAGVVVDAQGVLRVQTYSDPTGQLTAQRLEAARAALDSEIARPSPLRMVSLTRLERAVERQMEIGRQPTHEMQYLAGLTRVRYVFVYPETGDVVLAGPAEGWAEDISGRVRGVVSGRPTLLLEDLVVALRAYPPNRTDSVVIGCSIDPTAEGLVRMQQFLRSLRGRVTPSDAPLIVQGLRTSLGLQEVSVLGVSPNTHFAKVMVEADYRMKLIGIGLERPPIKLASYVDRANPAQVARNAMQRWYFTPDYECVRASEDDLAMELVGDGVKLVGSNEMVTQDGERRQAASADRASTMFVNAFTKKYPELAEKSHVFAQLRSLVDLAVAAAFIQEHDHYGKAGWRMATFGDESKLAVETHQAPVEVETAVASVWRGNQLMTPVGGGVNIQAHAALDTSRLLEDADGKVKEARQQIDPRQLGDEQWWWD